MSGNHDPQTASAPQAARLMATDSPHFGLWKANEQRVSQTEDDEQATAPPARARQHAQADDLADFLWRRQEHGHDYLQFSDGDSSIEGSSPHEGKGAPDSETWRDALLAEVEDLAKTLKEKVARYSSLRAAQSSALAADPANETAVLWIQHALEDIAATALGINVASRELFLQAASSGEQESNSEEPGNAP